MEKNEKEAFGQLMKVADYARSVIVSVGDEGDPVREISITAVRDYGNEIHKEGCSFDNPLIYFVDVEYVNIPFEVSEAIRRRRWETVEEALDFGKRMAAKINTSTADLFRAVNF